MDYSVDRLFSIGESPPGTKMPQNELMIRLVPSERFSACFFQPYMILLGIFHF